MSKTSFETQPSEGITVLRLHSSDGTNRLTRASLVLLMETLGALRHGSSGLVIQGNSKFFSAGAELQEIAALSGRAAFEFAGLGQRLTKPSLSRCALRFPDTAWAGVSTWR